jgi:hypothetical protein
MAADVEHLNAEAFVDVEYVIALDVEHVKVEAVDVVGNVILEAVLLAISPNFPAIASKIAAKIAANLTAVTALPISNALVHAIPSKSRRTAEVGTCGTTTPSPECLVTRAFSTSEEFQIQWSLLAMPRTVRR